MTVQARTGMGFWQGGQTARALQVKNSKEFHAPFSRKSHRLAMQRRRIVPLQRGYRRGLPADTLQAVLFDAK
jgi:hypothetical protein